MGLTRKRTLGANECLLDLCQASGRCRQQLQAGVRSGPGAEHYGRRRIGKRRCLLLWLMNGSSSMLATCCDAAMFSNESRITRLRSLPEGMSPSSALGQEVPPDLSTWLPTGSVDKRASREVVFRDSEAAASIHRPFICITRPWTALARLTPSAYPPAPWTGYGGSLSCASFAGSSGLTRAGRPVIGLRRAPLIRRPFWAIEF